VADVGCGPGVLANEFAQLVGAAGHVIAIDRDRSMIAAAYQSGRDAEKPPRTTYYLGDCTALPLRTAALDAYYCERVLQHLRDPGASIAVAEAMRAVKPGGRLAIADTDWTTLSINSDEPDLANRITAAHLARFPNPSAGARLAQLLVGAGATDTHIARFVLTIEGETATGLLTRRARSSLVRSVLSTTERRRWRSSMARARAKGLCYGQLTMILATARPGIFIAP